MKICHVCKAECEDNAEFCPVCNANLETADNTEEYIVENPILVASFEDFVSAEIFMDILNENGIEFTCDQPEIRVTFGGGLVANNIFVDEKNFEEAKKLYDDFSQSESIFDGE